MCGRAEARDLLGPLLGVEAPGTPRGLGGGAEDGPQGAGGGAQDRVEMKEEKGGRKDTDA